jgi:hypothetical protein
VLVKLTMQWHMTTLTAAVPRRACSQQILSLVFATFEHFQRHNLQSLLCWSCRAEPAVPRKRYATDVNAILNLKLYFLGLIGCRPTSVHVAMSLVPSRIELQPARARSNPMRIQPKRTRHLFSLCSIQEHDRQTRELAHADPKADGNACCKASTR